MNVALSLQVRIAISPNTQKAYERLEDKLKPTNSYEQRMPLPTFLIFSY